MHQNRCPRWSRICTQHSPTATEDHHLRGSFIEDARDRATQLALWQQKQPGQLQMGFVPIAFQEEQQHFLLAGAPGTGKSLSLKWMMADIRQRGQKALVYDPVGDAVELFYRPGFDIILNPLDERDAGWYPWADMERHDLPAVAKMLVPDPQGQADPFWANAAQAVLQALFSQCQQIDEVIRLGLMAEDEELRAVVRKAGMIGLVGAEKTFSGVRATLAAPLQKIALVHNKTLMDSQAGRAFSLTEWVKNDNDGRWVFLLSDKGQAAALAPLHAWWLNTVVRAALSATPSPDRRIWLFLDELPTLGKQEMLAPALSEGRKFGLIGVLGLQTIQQLREIYGREGAAVLWGLPKNRLMLRISDHETADMISAEIGEYQRRRITTGSSYSENVGVSHGTSMGGGMGEFAGGMFDGVFGSRNTTHSSGQSWGTNKSESLVTERAVLPSEIMALPDLEGYLRAGGEIVRVRLPVPEPRWVSSQPARLYRPPRALPSI
ncbi:type IV secretion system DNA-binding domain-containing protein [Acidithiobacillus sp. AC3]